MQNMSCYVLLMASMTRKNIPLRWNPGCQHLHLLRTREGKIGRNLAVRRTTSGTSDWEWINIYGPAKCRFSEYVWYLKKHPPSKFNHHNPWMSFFVGSRSLWVIAIPWHLWCISITSVTSQTLWYWPSWSRTQWFLKGYARNEYQSRSPASSHV